MTDEEPKQPHHFRTAIITFALMGVLYGVFAAWYNRTHPPYKWPVIPADTAQMPSPNAFDYFEDAHSLVKDDDVAGNGWLTPPAGYTDPKPTTQAQRDKAAAENLPVIDKVLEGLRYAYSSPPDPTGMSVGTQFAHCRDVSRVLLFEGLYSAQHNKWDNALAAELTAFRLGAAMTNDRSFFGVLTGASCEAIGRRRAWDDVAHVSGQVAIRSASVIINVDDKMPTAAAALQQLEWLTEADLMRQFRQPNWQDQLIPDSESDTGNSIRDEMTNLKYRSISAESAMKAYTTYTDAGIRNSRLPYPAYLASPKPKAPATIFGSMLYVDDGRERIRRENAFALNELLAASLALRAYKLDHGNYPPALSALVPGYLPRVPMDPYTDGKPLTYKLTASGYLLYSVGSDGKDDAGKPIFDSTRKGAGRYGVTNELQSGDIVAGVNH